jgi:hypothetical protein
MKITFYLLAGGIIGLIYTLTYYFGNRKLLKSAESFSAQILDLKEEIIPAFGKKGKANDEKYCALTLFIPSKNVIIKVRTNIYNMAKLKGEFYVNVCRIDARGKADGLKKAAQFVLENDLKTMPAWLALTLSVICIGGIIGGVVRIVAAVSGAVIF